MSNLPSFWRDSSFSGSSNPFRELTRMQRQMDTLFNDLWTNGAVGQESSMMSSFTPSCDVEETEAHYLMSFDLPGVKKEDIKVELRDGQLTVSGERNENREEKKKNRSTTERFHGSFQRSFTLPAGLKPEQIETEYKDGVLRIAVPKTEAVKTHQIKISEGKPGFWDKLLGHKKEDAKPGLQTAEQPSAQSTGKPGEKVA